MTYKLFDAQHEYCKNENAPILAIRPHAFIAGAKWVIKCLSTIPIDEVVDEVVELCEELKQEEEQTNGYSKICRHSCESCDRFDECYTSSGRMREFCKVYGANVVFKFKDREKWEHQKEMD